MSGRDALAARLDAAISARVTPAAVVETGSSAGVGTRLARGTLTYDAGAPACTAGTVFDLASLTKVLCTTTLGMRAVETGRLALDARVADLEPRWRGADREPVTVRHLLAHASGLPAHVKLYEQATGLDAFLDIIAVTPLASAPGTASVYSDLGFILLGALVGRALGAPLDTAFAPVAAECGALTFHPPAEWTARTAPTERDGWRGRLLVGEVHDENAAAVGGVAGHAGVFGTVDAVGRFAQAVLQTFADDTWLARRETLVTFATRVDVPGSSRALGWDTMLPTSSCGTHLSPRAIGHTGFTGTSLWIDPARDLYVTLRTNRVHPTRQGDGIQALRRDVADWAATSDTAR